MAYFQGTVSHNSTGTKNITVGFQPLGVKITVSQKTNTAQTFAHLSVGSSDGTKQRVDAFYQDTTGGTTVKDTTKIVSHWERVSGTITEKVAAHVDQATAPWTATEVKYIVDTADVNYQFLVEVWG